MGRYDNDYDSSPVAARQRDLVLSINEFCFLQNKRMNKKTANLC